MEEAVGSRLNHKRQQMPRLSSRSHPLAILINGKSVSNLKRRANYLLSSLLRVARVVYNLVKSR